MKCGKRVALGLRVFLFAFFWWGSALGSFGFARSFGSRASGTSQDDGKLTAVEFAAGKDWLF